MKASITPSGMFTAVMTVASTNANSLTFRASGGVRFFSDTNATTGVFTAARPTGVPAALVATDDMPPVVKEMARFYMAEKGISL